MVAMNPQTWDQDVAEIDPGGYLFYDSTRPMPPSKFRDDITVLGMPLTAICNAALQRPAPAPAVQEHHLCRRADRAPRHRAGRGREADRRAVQGQGQADPAEHRGARHGPRARAGANSAARSTSRSQRADAVGDRIFIEGNNAAGLGAVYGGATVAAWYPITPSTSLAEAFGKHCRTLPGRQGDRQEPLRHRPGRGRARLDRHGHRRGVERRARLHRDRRARHLADAGVHRPRLFRRDSGGDLRRAARRPVDRHADAHAAVRHPHLPPTPRTATPSTCCSSRRTRTSASNSRRSSFDLADRLQTPIFVMIDLDIGMNEWLCKPLAWDDSRALRPRQGADRGGARGRPRVRPLSRRRRRRHHLPHLSRHAPDQGRLLHPRHLAATATPDTARKAPTTSTTCSGCSRKFETAKALVPAPIATQGRRSRPASASIYYGSTAPAMNEALEALAAEGIHLDTLRVRAFPFADAVADFVLDARPRLRRRAEPRRAAAHAPRQRMRARPGAAGPDPPL